MAVSIWPAWEKWAPILCERPLILFLDYDGTLTKIVKHPKLAHLSSSCRQTLRELSLTAGIKICVISGRSLADIKKLIRLPRLIYAGNHGLELEGPGTRYVHPAAAKMKSLIKRVVSRLKKELRKFPGIIVENKTYTASVHYRNLARSKISKAKETLERIAAEYLRIGEMTLREGKKVWELRPAVSWNKGRMVSRLLSRALARTPNTLPVYAGDDLTDEDAFETLKSEGLTIKVTANRGESTKASYFVQTTGEIFKFLKRIQKLKSKKEASECQAMSR